MPKHHFDDAAVGVVEPLMEQKLRSQSHIPYLGEKYHMVSMAIRSDDSYLFRQFGRRFSENALGPSM
jgi:hypothetical protein